MGAQATYDIRPVRQDAGLHAWMHRAESPRLVVSFSGIGLKDAEAPPYEFARSATNDGRDNALFIADPARSWLNREGIVEEIAGLMEETARACGAERVTTLGHSMGGYTAAVMPAFTKVDVAVALSPQLSVNPEVAPDETRWSKWREAIRAHRIRSVAEHVVPGPLYYVFFGTHGREAPQRDRFPLLDNIKFFLLPRTVHNTPQMMKRAGILDSVVQFAFEGRTRMVRRQLAQHLNARQVTVPTEHMLARAAADAKLAGARQ